MHLRRSVAAVATTVAVAATGLAGPAVAATGDATGFPLPSGGSSPSAIASVATGDLWVTLKGSGTLASLTTAGAVTPRPVSGLGATSGPAGIAQDGNGRIWFTEQNGNAVSSVTDAGADYKRVALKAGSSPTAITRGPDGNMWFVETDGDRVGRVTPSGSLTEFNLTAGSEPVAIVPGPDNNLLVALAGKNTIGKLTTAGVLTQIDLPGSDVGIRGIAVDDDKNIWFTQSKTNRIGRINANGNLAEFTVPTANSSPTAITGGADGNVWFIESKASKVARITSNGSISEFTVGSNPTAITGGADGNVWVAEESNRVSRVLTGVVPVSTANPTISGSSTAAGAVLTSSNGTWRYQPTSYAYQWQRCTSADAASCADIAGATATTYTITATDAGTWLRSLVRASNLNGAAAKVAASALLQMGARPVPPPVTGGMTVTIAPNVTATFRAVNRTKRHTLRSYRVRFNSAAVRGKVRMTLVNSAGVEVLVIAKGKWARAQEPDSALAKRWRRIPWRIAPGAYTVRAVFTPHPSLTTTYAVATMTRAITIR